MADTGRVRFESRMPIDGKLVDGEAGTFTNIDPPHEVVLCEVADAPKADKSLAIDAAWWAFDESDWSTNLELRKRRREQFPEAHHEHELARHQLRYAVHGSGNTIYSARVRGRLRFGPGLGVIMMVARHNITKLFGTAIAVAALSVTTPGTAAAYTTTDFAFLSKVFADGVNFGEPDNIIQRARVVCDAFGAGDSPADVHAALLTNSAFAPRQAAVFMADAVQFYCPAYADLFIS